MVFFRLVNGLGAVVALNDILPGGLWKGGGVVALVPVGGAGFTIAGLVYVFHLERYRPVARGAVLLGLMCYGSVALGLTFDIGVWWRIVFPIVHWQLHSTLFEIAWCIMLYLGVLAVELSHAVLERFNLPRLLKVVKRGTVLFVILGICLSTLHQSSLGTLFLATPYRLHPLWYTGLLPLLFFITAIGLGCLTISWVTLLVHRLYDVEPPMKALSGLARIAAIVLGVYLILRLGSVLAAGKAGHLFTSGWSSVNFWVELLLSAALPVALLARTSTRRSRSGLFWVATAGIVGMSLNRINVAGLATLTSTRGSYFPAWSEWALTSGLLAAAGLVFLFCVERLRVYERIDQVAVAASRSAGPVDLADWRTLFFRNPLADLRVYSMVFVIAVGLAAGCLPESAISGSAPVRVPTRGPKVVQVGALAARSKPARSGRSGSPGPAPTNPTTVEALRIDGDRNGRYVLFDHRGHVRRQRARGRGCKRCHHANHPKSKATGCYKCHADVYQPRSVFSHSGHIKALGGNRGCGRCHADPAVPRVRGATVPCGRCHRDLVKAASSALAGKTMGAARRPGLAPGYMSAMHGLCINCHKAEARRRPRLGVGFARCAFCHRGQPRPRAEGRKGVPHVR